MKKIFLRLYNITAKNLPLSNSKFNIGQKQIRYWFAKHIVKSIGTNVNIEKGASLNYSLIVGDNSGIGVRCEINGELCVGNNVLIAPDCIFYTQNHEFHDATKLIISQGYSKPTPIIIEDDVWIGRRVMVLPGVHIGKGAVIGAGAVVAKDIPSYAIAVGNPVQIKGYRK